MFSNQHFIISVLFCELLKKVKYYINIECGIMDKIGIKRLQEETTFIKTDKLFEKEAVKSIIRNIFKCKTHNMRPIFVMEGTIEGHQTVLIVNKCQHCMGVEYDPKIDLKKFQPLKVVDLRTEFTVSSTAFKVFRYGKWGTIKPFPLLLLFIVLFYIQYNF